MRSYGRIVVVILLASGWMAVAASQDLDLVNAMVIDGIGESPQR